MEDKQLPSLKRPGSTQQRQGSCCSIQLPALSTLASVAVGSAGDGNGSGNKGDGGGNGGANGDGSNGNGNMTARIDTPVNRMPSPPRYVLLKLSVRGKEGVAGRRLLT